MGAILACALFSVMLTMHFRMHARWKLHTFPTIVVNYITCTVLLYFMGADFGPWSPMDLSRREWLATLQGGLFILGFYLIAVSVQRYGLTLTTLWQKMAVILPVCLAILFYEESYGWVKLLGIALALGAILCSVERPPSDREKVDHTAILILFLAVFIPSGLIDFIFFHADAAGLTHAEDIGFPARIFSMAAIYGIIISIVGMARGKMRYSWREIIGGITLGIPNVFSLVFLMKAIGGALEGSLVFPMLNVSIILLTTVVDLSMFKQRLGRRGYGAVALAILSITVLYYASRS